jgi:hypothetical protein
VASRIVLLAFAAAIILPAQTDRCLIRGQVSDTSSGAIGNALISVYPKDSPKFAFRGNAQYDNGTFCIVELSPGTYTVKAWQQGFRVKRVYDVVARSGKTTDVGIIQLEVAGCDAPGINCADFITPPTFPSKPYPIIVDVRADLHINRDCGVDLSKGKAVCHDRAKETDVIFTEEHNRLFLRSLNGARIDPSCSGLYRDEALQISGLGTGDDFCIKTKKGYTSHLFFEGDDVEPTNTKLNLWMVTKK